VSIYQRVAHDHEGLGLVNESLEWYSPLQLGSVLLEFVRFARFRYRRNVLIQGQRKCLTIRFVYFVVFPEKGAVSFRAHLAKISRGVEIPLCRERAVGVGNGESSRIRGHPHLASPIERTEWIGGGWSNVPRRTHFRVCDVKRDRRRDPGSAEIITCATRELKLVNNRCVFQRNRQCVFRYLHGVIRDLHEPEKTIRSDARIEVMDLLSWGPRTGEPEINSYLDEGAMRLSGGRASGGESRLRADIITLVDTDVGDHLVGLAGVVGGEAEGVTHGSYPAEIRDAMRLCVQAVVDRSDSRKELVDEPGWWNNVAPGKRQWLNGWYLNLSPGRDTGEEN